MQSIINGSGQDFLKAIVQITERFCIRPNNQIYLKREDKKPRHIGYISHDHQMPVFFSHFISIKDVLGVPCFKVPVSVSVFMRDDQDRIVIATGGKKYIHNISDLHRHIIHGNEFYVPVSTFYQISRRAFDFNRKARRRIIHHE